MKKDGIFLLIMASLFLLSLSCAPTETLPDKGVNIPSPKENDVIQADSSYEILWKAEVAESEFGTKVTIEFSKDGGKSWQMVAENVPNTGKYGWKVPKVDSTQCKIRIFSQYRPAYRGTSGMFTVK